MLYYYRGSKINGFSLKIYGMVIASFKVLNKLGRARYFQKSFLLAKVNVKMILIMLFFILSNFDVKFPDKKLT